MNPSTLNHFHKVARNMHNYVAASTQNYYPVRDSIPMGDYQASFYSNIGLADHFANRLYSFGMPNSIVNLGYDIGYFIDVYV